MEGGKVVWKSARALEVEGEGEAGRSDKEESDRGVLDVEDDS